MGLVGNMVLQHLHQSGLANACITREQDHVPMSCLDLLPPFQKERDFRFATNQRCESSWLNNIQATGDPTCFEYSVHLERLGHPSEGRLTQ